MPVQIRAELSGTPLPVQMRAFHGRSVAAIEAALEGVREGLLLELRQDIARAFPGNRRMPTMITATVYPAREDGRPPVLWVHPRKGSNAAQILGAHRGVTIQPTRAGTALAIPTKHVPRVRRGGGPMTPDEVSKHFGEKLDVMPNKSGGKAWGFLVLRRQTIGRSGRVRRATEGRARQGRTARPIVMFVLVPAVTMPQRLRPDETMRKWADLVPGFIDQAERRLAVTVDEMAAARAEAARISAAVRALPRSGPFGTPYRVGGSGT